MSIMSGYLFMQAINDKIAAANYLDEEFDKLSVKVDPKMFRNWVRNNHIPKHLVNRETYEMAGNALKSDLIDKHIADFTRKAEEAISKGVLPESTIREALAKRIAAIERTRPNRSDIAAMPHAYLTRAKPAYPITPAQKVFNKFRTRPGGARYDSETIARLYNDARRAYPLDFGLPLAGPEGPLPKSAAETNAILRGIFG